MVNLGALEFVGGSVIRHHKRSRFVDRKSQQVLVQLVSIAAANYFIITCFLMIIIGKGIGFRVNEEDEEMRLDTTQNGETGYNLV